MNEDSLIYFDSSDDFNAYILAVSNDGLLYYTRTDDSSKPKTDWKVVFMNEDAIKVIH